MLIPPPLPCRRPALLRPPGLLSLLAACLLLAGGRLLPAAALPAVSGAGSTPAAGPPAAAGDPPNGDQVPGRPPDLVVLQRRLSPEGPSMLGVYGAVADPTLPGLWRAQLWQERIGLVNVSSEVLRCDPAAPMRISSDGRQRILRELNPGGLITPANRLDHLIWWAVCVPRLAGVDPAGLAGEARRLGYSGRLQERLQILP